MNKLRIYIDTSVIGGCFDKEFSEFSNKLFEEIIIGKKIAVVSDVVLEEIAGAGEKIQMILKKIPKENIQIINRNSESEDLSFQYINAKAISPKFSDDALHIAIATINNVDLLVSWNFKHIVNYNRILKYNSINLLNGYKHLEIRSPKEVLDDEEII
ncbi:MAG: PIN domain-containing protein [Candidatus Kapabacteria bacterium]|nr:PIN domain-containing protein [Candidatus Kapabacteria bacterium]